jgi:hypothetical protein
MTPENFVEALKTECRDSAVEGCVDALLSPPGRRPAAELLELSRWFNSLGEADRTNVIGAMRQAAHETLLGVLCVIDGVRVIEGLGEKSEFRLTATHSSQVSTIAPSRQFLHDILGTD